MKYATGSAFRQALEERIRDIHAEQNIPIVRLRKQIAFERFIARLIRYQPEQWVLKGGLALQLRLGEQARTTKDIDLLNTAISPSIYDSMAESASMDLGDWFAFEVERPEGNVENKPGGKRYLVHRFLDGRLFENFHVDVGVGDIVLEAFEWLSFGSILGFAGIEPTSVPCYPIVQQIAEKLHALTRRHVSGGSSRSKDLADILLLAKLGSINGDALKLAIVATFESRATHPLPAELSPLPKSLSREYEHLADTLDLAYGTFDAAEQALGQFLNPVLSDVFPGIWDAALWGWRISGS
ncbi:MAG: nucleotidyl transferase AbiEii/AbiGii toxin family protein [Anaerolineales bacterium]